MWAPDKYADSFHRAAPNVTLGLTTTPRWGSSGNGFRAVGSTVMPQAFTGEVPSATIPACVDHAKAWGWDIAHIRPLVQVYKTAGVRPSATTYNEDAANYNVGVVPYTLEQALDGEGQEMLRTLGPSILREPAESAPPEPEVEPPPSSSPPDLPFNGPLYPPDAAAKGKTPSPDSAQIVAVKRAVSRAGFWRWQSFDDTYSNGFSHGREGDGPGVEGFQGAHVDLEGKAPSGWYGSKTHEALRTFKLPSGPNKGQWAFDQTAINLYRSCAP